VHNFGPEPQTVTLDLSHRVQEADIDLADVLTGDDVRTDNGSLDVVLEGYGYRWLRIHPAGDLRIP
jgi:hypothetical protein